MNDQNSEDLLADVSFVGRLKERKAYFLEVTKRKIKDITFLWKFGFPSLLVIVVIWSSFLLFDGFTSVLKSEEGATREAITDPLKEGFEAFVEQTWAELIITEDESGDLAQVAVVSISDRQSGGGTVLLLPPELKVGQCLGDCTLGAQYLEAGLEVLRRSVSGLLETEFSDSTTLNPQRWETLVEPIGELSIRIQDTGEIKTLSESEIFGFIARKEGESFLSRQKAQGDFWRSWISALKESGDVDGSLPLMRIPVVELISALAKSSFTVLDNLWSDFGNNPEVNPDLLSGVIHDMFPFPATTENDQRPTVRLLNGTDDFSRSTGMQELLRDNGANVTVIGNFRSFNVIQTRVIYKDLGKQGEAERLAAAIGAHVIKDELVSPVADLTVLIGRDFLR